MEFKGKGKGPLELPRLSSIGPMSEAADQIGKLVFRGSNIEDFNNDEFTNNAIDGRPVDVWTLDTATAARRYDLTPREIGRIARNYRNKAPIEQIIDEFRIGPAVVNDFNVEVGQKEVPIQDLVDNGLIANHFSDSVTGGISRNLGAGMRFAGTGGTELEKKAPLVMFLEKNRIPSRLIEVEYTSQFIQEHPAIAGAADTGGRMLAVPKLESDYELGNLIDFYTVGPWRGNVSSKDPFTIEDIRVDEGELVVKWFDDPLDGFRSLEPEKEIFAYTDQIDLDHSLFGICMYVGPNRIASLYKSVTDDELIASSSEERKEQLKIVHQEVQNRMKSYSDRLVSCYITKNIRTNQSKIPRSRFEFLYDGESITEDYEQAVPFTDPSKF